MPSTGYNKLKKDLDQFKNLQRKISKHQCEKDGNIANIYRERCKIHSTKFKKTSTKKFFL